MTQPRIFEGLEGVLVARTELSEVDGAGGRLTIRGHAIEALSGELPFEAMLGLLLDGKPPEVSLRARSEAARLPDASRLAKLQAELGAARVRAHAALAPRFAALRSSDPMTTLLSALATLPSDATPSDCLATAAVATAHWIRTQRGEPLLAPRPDSSHTLDLLTMTSGEVTTEAQGKLLDAYLVTVAEHGFNASTFAARVAASTGAALPAAMLAGVATLSGPLHGGAPGPVLDMLDAVGEPERALHYVRAELLAGRRIMGMGHRIYRVRDPRAFVLERALSAFRGNATASSRLALARAVESAAEAELARKYPERPIRANVEFYTALLLEALAIPRAAFTAIFACARIAGYAAHHAEQRHTGRLIRPSALYVGSRG